MSDSEKVDKELALDMIGLLVGFVILITIGIMMTNYDTWRTDYNQPQTQAIYLFIALPILIPIAMFGVDIAARGAISVGSAMINYVQAQQQ